MQCGNEKQFQLKYENVSSNANGFYDNAKDESSEIYIKIKSLVRWKGKSEKKI